jgi:hypothetical protein
MAEVFPGASAERAKDEAVYHNIIGLLQIDPKVRPAAMKNLHQLIKQQAGMAVVEAAGGKPLTIGGIAALVNVIGFWAAVDLLEKAPATNDAAEPATKPGQPDCGCGKGEECGAVMLGVIARV